MSIKSEILNAIADTVQLSIDFFSLCRASCFKSGNPPNALASLRLCGLLKKRNVVEKLNLNKPNRLVNQY
ncbi:hypothetical protein [Nostoc sp. FACHB-888]|uniref:hypothetical protein n=1 Tax=Nostoc sp. FACHB-888 TaxID=2692842 RepID=UPI0016896C94|nr:hypothetical protein [Nostoc sp. FACHB-888]MBD2246262.1 hypothetical protein [Nostoc sp. FACHB-888]